MTMKRKPIPKKIRKEIWTKYDGHCAYCGREISLKEMQVDHIVPLSFGRGSDTPDNMNPACRMCNYYKGAFSVEGFRKELGKIVERLHKVFIYRLAGQYNLIAETNAPIKFYYEDYRKTEEPGQSTPGAP